MASQPGAALRLVLLISGIRTGLLQPGRSSGFHTSSENYPLASSFQDQLRNSGESQNLVTENVTVVEGDVAIISCRVKNNIDDSVIQLLNPNQQTIYFRDFRPLKDSRFQLVEFSSNELRVSLSNVSIEDEGRYFCQLYTDPPQEAITTITVLVPPHDLVIDVQKDLHKEGEKVEMNCTAMASKPAATIRWFKGDQELQAGRTEVEPLGDKMFRVHSQISLIALREDDGVPIVCQVDHPAVKEMQARQHLEIQYKPFVLVSVSYPQGLTREGESLELTCRVVGKPKPERILWQRLDDELPDHAIVSGDNLLITNLNKTDNGTYRCEASNSLGKASADYILFVYDPPTTTTTTTTTTIPPPKTTSTTNSTSLITPDDEIAKTRQTAVAMGNQLQLNITENDVIKVLDSHSQELTNEDLMELDQEIELREEAQDIETPQLKKFLTKELADAFRLIEAGMAKLEAQDSDTERFAKVYRTVTEGLKCYRAIYDEKKKSSIQTSLDAYFNK